MNLDLITTLFAFILSFQTIVLIVLTLKRYPNSTRHWLLVLMLGFYLLSLLNFAVFRTLWLYDYASWIPFLQLELVFGFGPSLYIYTKSLTDSSYRFTPRQWLHFIPVVLEFVFYRTSWFRTGAIQLSGTPSSWENWVFLSVQWGGFLSVVLYLSISIFLLVKYKKWVREHFSNLERRRLHWYEKAVVAYGIFWLVWILFQISDIFLFQQTLKPYYFNLGFIIVAILTLWIALQGYAAKQNETAGFLGDLNRFPKRQQDASQLESIAETLQTIMDEKQYYLDSDLTLSKLSKLTTIPDRDISRALNHVLNVNFHEFVNDYRVATFKSNLQLAELSHLSLLGIAMESGFGSKSTFNLVFKAKEGITPKQYLQKIQTKRS
ncbi:MAG: helix-turn-helix domain-containing protein [Bacteroidota bacterium]